MPVETPQPDQLLAAAKDARGKISPLPAIKPENSEALSNAFYDRFDLLQLVDDYGRIPKDQLGGKTPQEKLKEEGLSAHTASSIYEVMMIASYPPESHQLPQSYQKDFPLMMESIPPFLRRLSLGGEFQALLDPQYRLNIETLVAGGEKTVRAEYDAIVDRLNKVSHQETLRPDQRLSVTRDVISLLTLVSHPQTQHIVTDIIIPPDSTQPAQKPLPLSSVAASYLTKYGLGEEMGRMLMSEQPVPEPDDDETPERLREKFANLQLAVEIEAGNQAGEEIARLRAELGTRPTVENFRAGIAEARQSGIAEGRSEGQKTIAELREEIARLKETHAQEKRAADEEKNRKDAQITQLQAELKSRPTQADVQAAEERGRTAGREEAPKPGQPAQERSQIDTGNIGTAIKDALGVITEGKNITTLSLATQTLLYQLLGTDSMAVLSQIATRPVMGQEQVNKLTEFDAFTQALKIAMAGSEVPADILQKLSGDLQRIIAGLAERNKQTSTADNRLTEKRPVDNGSGDNGERFIAPYETDGQWENLATQTYSLTGKDGNTHILTLAQVIETINDPESPYGIVGTVAVLKSIGLNTEALAKLGSPRSTENRENWRKALEKIGRQINRGVHPDTNPRTNNNHNLQVVAKFASSFANLVRDKHLALSSGLYLDLLKK